MAGHQIRGRGFSPFNFAGYQLWRFWLERERLPFMDIHQTGTVEDRKAFADVLIDPTHWPELRDRYRLDYAILDRRELGSDRIVEALDADRPWALVFLDDVAALFVRRGGPLKVQADSFAYRHLAAGAVRSEALAGRWAADSALRTVVRPELERATRQSRWSATLQVQLANLALADGDFGRARRWLERALAANPRVPGAHQRLGMVALWEKRSRDAFAEFQREQRLGGRRSQLELGMGLALEMAEDREGALRHYRRALQQDPSSRMARARLDELAGKGR